MEYLDITDAKIVKDFKIALNNLQEKSQNNNGELEDYFANYSFISYKGTVFQIKSTDDINTIKEHYILRRKYNTELLDDLDFLNTKLGLRHIRANNRLLIRIANFLDLNRESVKQSDYFKELRLISMQINQKSKTPNFHYRAIYDLFENAGYQIISLDKIDTNDFNQVIDFLIGQIMFTLKNYTISSRKFNVVFNLLKNKYE